MKGKWTRKSKMALMAREGHRVLTQKGTRLGSGHGAAGPGLKEQGISDLALVVAKHLSRDNLGMVLGTEPTLNNADMGMHRSLNSKIDTDALPLEEAPGMSMGRSTLPRARAIAV